MFRTVETLMRAIRIIALVSWSSLAAAAQVPYDTRVASIEVRGGDPDAADALSLRTGDRLTPAALRQAIQSLYQAAGYGRIEVRAESGPAGTRLVFEVEPPYFFATIRLEPETVLERAVSSYVTLPYGRRFSRNEVDRIVDGIRAELQGLGHFQAGVEPILDFDPATRLVTTTLRVEPGPRAVVGRIEFAGQDAFPVDALRDALDVEAGERFERRRIDERLASVAELFSERDYISTRLTVEAENYDPESNAVDVEIAVEAGDRLDLDVTGYDLSRDLREELLPFYDERRVDADLVEEGRRALLEHLFREGFLEAGVVAGYELPGPESSHSVDYVVTTGDRVAIREVRIEGNDYFADDMLYERIGITSDGLFSRGVFSEALLEEAAEMIRQLYRTSGFTGTTVTAEASRGSGAIAVAVRIVEGRRLRVGQVEIAGAGAYDARDVAGWSGVASGEFFSQGLVQEGRRAITARYHERGHDAVRVESIVEPAGDDSIDVTYRVTEGPASTIRRIFVAGNTRTQEKIVHRNSGLESGRAFDPEAILEAQRQLYATGLFNRVEIVPLERPELRERDVLIQLEDAGPVVLTYGVGAQDREGIRGTVEVTHSNLWGLDRSISARIRGSRREQRFQTTYREPRLFNWELDGFASLFVERARQPAFDASKVDFSFQSLKRFANDDSLLLTASYQTVNLRDIRDNRHTDAFPDQVGVYQISRVGASYIRDTRNDVFDPSRGNYFTGTFQFANSALGSEINFTSVFTQFSLFRPAKGAVIAASARFGWNQPYGRTQSLPITERYFAGGSTTLRGFSLDDAGPIGASRFDPDSPGGVRLAPAGGNALAIVNLEYRFPIPFLFSGVGGAVFYDTGTVFERISDFGFGDFTHTLGLGFRYQTPLGPIRVDLGFNLNRQPGESLNKAFLTLGHAF